MLARIGSKQNSHIFNGNWEEIWQFLIKLNTHLPYDTEIPLRYFSKERKLYLVFLITVPLKSIHIATNGRLHLFCMTDIPLCMCSISSIHSSSSGYLGYRHVLAIVNNVAVNMECKYLLELVFSFIPRRELAVLIFWGNCILFSIVFAPTYVPTNSAQGFPFLHFLIKACYCVSFS